MIFFLGRIKSKCIYIYTEFFFIYLTYVLMNCNGKEERERDNGEKKRGKDRRRGRLGRGRGSCEIYKKKTAPARSNKKEKKNRIF